MKKLLLFLCLLLTPFLNAMEEQKPLKRKRVEETDLQKCVSKKPKQDKASLKRKHEDKAAHQKRAPKRLHLEEKLIQSLGIPNEIWAQILIKVYFDVNVLNKAISIYRAIDAIQAHLNKYHKTISLVCKTFRDLNITQKQCVNITMREFYTSHLNTRFLEIRKCGGLFLKHREWHENSQINNLIAEFISTRNSTNNTVLIKLLKDIDNSYDLIPLLRLLLFYGVDPNIKDDCKHTALHWLAFYHYTENPNYLNAAKLLLHNNANPNIKDNIGANALHRAVNCYHATTRNDIKLITLLLQHGADPCATNNFGETVFDIANERKFTAFKSLVKAHSRNYIS